MDVRPDMRDLNNLVTGHSMRQNRESMTIHNHTEKHWLLGLWKIPGCTGFILDCLFFFKQIDVAICVLAQFFSHNSMGILYLLPVLAHISDK